MPLISVITPASRGIKHLEHLLRDFKNQTFKDFEHLIVWDGPVPSDVRDFMDKHKNDYNIRFMSVDKDLGNMKASPGTRPRNYGIAVAQGTYCVFCDDDDRYKDTYLETFMSGMDEKSVSVVQMSCQESRIYKNGDPNRIVLIPEVGLPGFPIICHVSTTCFCVPTKWAKEDPWQYLPEHDFRFIQKIVEKHKPQIIMHHGMCVDTDGLVLKGLTDWVSIPPFYRD